jgi:uncharacterized protein YdiU (UPF0061 family)
MNQESSKQNMLDIAKSQTVNNQGINNQGINGQATNKVGNVGWHFDNSYSRLQELFYERLNPTPVSSPSIVVFNNALATSLGLNAEALSSDSGVAFLAGNAIPKGAEPIAQAYAGHQFGHFTMLGDGRAIMLGEHITPNGDRFDIQLKGSGQTPFSRRGDGRATLGPMLREYIISEAMHALNIATTRSLAVVNTGEQVFRGTVLPGAILTRVATSHIRVGTFEYVTAQHSFNSLKSGLKSGFEGGFEGGFEAIKILADYTINRHYPNLTHADNPYLALLYAVIERQASLVAKWLMVGFVHGVMNTDNMALSGETIDYGPCAFMDVYNPATVFSSIDYNGRYAYNEQANIARWNIARFAETLLPLLHKDQKQAVAMAEEAIKTFHTTFHHHWLAGMRAKLGLFNEEVEDLALIETLLKLMHRHYADYTNTFRALALEKLPDEPLFRQPTFINWHQHWQKRLQSQSEPKNLSLALMNSCNPAVIPRNHLVEEALTAAVEFSDFTVMQKLLAELQNPYDNYSDDNPSGDNSAGDNSAGGAKYRSPPLPNGRIYQTFCGT